MISPDDSFPAARVVKEIAISSWSVEMCVDMLSHSYDAGKRFDTKLRIDVSRLSSYQQGFRRSSNLLLHRSFFPPSIAQWRWVARRFGRASEVSVANRIRYQKGRRPVTSLAIMHTCQPRNMRTVHHSQLFNAQYCLLWSGVFLFCTGLHFLVNA